VSEERVWVNGRKFAVENQSLDLSGRGIKQISEIEGFQNLKTLQKLILSDNEIYAIEEIKNLAELRELDISYNQITNLAPLKHLTHLENLNASYNRVRETKDLAILTNLKLLDLAHNNIDLTNGLERLVNLEYLYIEGNPIFTDFLSSGPDFDRDLFLYYWMIAGKIGRKSDEFFDMVRQRQKKDAIFHVPHLRKAIQNAEGKPKEDRSLHLRVYYPEKYDPEFESEPFSYVTQLRDKKIIFNCPSHLKLYDMVCIAEELKDDELARVRKIKLTRCELSALWLKKYESLEILDLSYNRISELRHFEYLQNLRILNLRGNNIESIENLTGLSNLQELNLGYNKIHSLPDLSSLKNLRVLFLGNNNLTELTNIEDLPNLQILDLSSNPLQNLSGIPQDIIHLGISGIGISTKYQFKPLLPEIKGVEKFRNIEVLDLSWNEIPEIKGLDFPNLEYLNLSHNQISSTQGLESLSNLCLLDLSFNQISEIARLENLPMLIKLNLRHNQIRSLKGLASLSNLQELDMNDNMILETTGIKPLKNLRRLDVTYNPIEFFQQGLKIFPYYCEPLQIPEMVKEYATKIFRQLLNTADCKKRSLWMLVKAALFFACQRLEFNVTLKDIYNFDASKYKSMTHRIQLEYQSIDSFIQEVNEILAKVGL